MIISQSSLKHGVHGTSGVCLWVFIICKKNLEVNKEKILLYVLKYYIKVCFNRDIN